MSTPQTRILHLHIEKTGGTALRFALQKAIGPQGKRFPYHHENKLDGIRPDDWDLISGHFGYTRLAPLGGRIMVILRDPVDRFVSVYYYWRQMQVKGINVSRVTDLATKYSLEDFAAIKDDVALLEQFFHRMTWQLADTFMLSSRQNLRREGLTESALLARAVEHLRSCAVVGLQNRMDSFTAQFTRQFGLTLHIERLNVTENRVPVSDISVAARRRILEWVYLDMELYQAACAIVAASEP